MFTMREAGVARRWRANDAGKVARVLMSEEAATAPCSFSRRHKEGVRVLPGIQVFRLFS